MKKLLVLLFSSIILPISVYASDVYYCSEDFRTGYDMSNNLKQKNFDTGKFKIMIDFDNEKVTSENMFFTSNYSQKCFFHENALNCINAVGVAFSINKPTLRFYRTDIYNREDTTQDPFLSHGTCEKF